MQPHVLEIGACARVESSVTAADTAVALGSGDVPVLATPRVVALLEAATVAATAGALPTGMTTVGVNVTIDHRAATPVGRTVLAEACLAEIDGHRLRFDVVLHDGDVDAATGSVWRVMVDRQRFIAKATR